MSAPRDDELLRRGAVLLSALVLTKDDGLPRFRAQRVADQRVTDEQLAQARTVLDAVTYALLGEGRDNWKRIEEAHRILRRNEPPKAGKPAQSPDAQPRVGSPPPIDPPVQPALAVASRAEPPLPPAVTTPVPAPMGPSSSPGPSPWLPNAAENAPALPAAMVAHLSAPTPFEAGPGGSLDETAALDPAMFAELAPTPFQAGVAQPPPSAVEHERADFAGETGILDAASIGDVVAAYPLPTKLPMAVERYAALVARSAEASEGELAELHREYAIADAAHRKRIDQEFSEAMSRDAALRQQFADYLRQWRDWLRQQPKG